MQQDTVRDGQQGVARLCSGCGKRQPDDAPEGLCPACLIRLAWDSPEPADLDETDSFGDSQDAAPSVCVRSPLATAEAKGSLDTTLDACRYVGRKPYDRGGIGDVFTATDRELHRTVALKRLRDRSAPSQRRFLLEAEITAKLDHPGVVPVHSLFHDEEGRPCYTMRFINGQSLADALDAYHAGPPDPIAFRRFLQSFIQICQTVAYAHSRGVIHRDLKPKNVMLGKFGETIVIDWGLAKVVGRGGEDEQFAEGDEQPANEEATLRPAGDTDREQTAMGSAVGTPVYMSPEQAAGRWDVIGPASDVYSLGALLYVVLTGHPPLGGENFPEIQQKIQRGDFPRPRTMNPATPKALEAVCLKAMALKPEDRYASARDLATEIERWLADEPVRAYREPATERLRRWARRRKGLVYSGIVCLVVLIISTCVVSLERIKADAALIDKLRAEAIEGRNNYLNFESGKYRRQIEQSAQNAVGGMAQVAQDPRFDDPSLKQLRENLLQHALDFWNDVIGTYSTLDRISDEHVYYGQRLLCLARLKHHEQALAEPRFQWVKARDPSGDQAYYLARIYLLCAAETEQPLEVAERYTTRAIELLLQAHEAHFL